jgi:predicted membrane GTPase involved in stress response
VEVPEEYMGAAVELLGKRRGIMVDMEASGFVLSLIHQIWNAIASFIKGFTTCLTMC